MQPADQSRTEKHLNTSIISLKSYLTFFTTFQYQNVGQLKERLLYLGKLDERYQTVCKVIDQLTFKIRIKSKLENVKHLLKITYTR